MTQTTQEIEEAYLKRYYEITDSPEFERDARLHEEVIRLNREHEAALKVLANG